jgi:hypothetical protein
MASLRQEALGLYLDRLRGEAPIVPTWWHDSGEPATADQVLHEIRDRFGIYAMKKKLRYDTYQAAMRAQDSAVRQKLLDLRYLIDKDNLTKEESAKIGRLYTTLNKDRNFVQEMRAMMDMIHYG